MIQHFVTSKEGEPRFVLKYEKDLTANLLQPKCFFKSTIEKIQIRKYCKANEVT